MSSYIRFLGWSAALLAISGCQPTDGTDGDTTPEEVDPPVASFSASVDQGIAPLAVSLDASASAQAGGPITLYSWSFGDGQTGSGQTVAHTYSDPGKYTARLTVIGPTNKQDQTDMVVTVLLDVTSLSTSPEQINFSATGQTQRVTVTGTLINEQKVDLTSEATFASGNLNVVTVDATGLVTAKGAGASVISVQYGDILPVAIPVNVTILDATALWVTPTRISFVAAGQTQALTATVDLSDGGTADVTAATSGTKYTSTDTKVVAVTADGLATAVGGGSAVISVKFASLPPAAVPVTVLDVESLSVTPSQILFTAADQTKTLKLTATSTDDTTTDVSGSTYGATYVSSDPSVASVDAEGVVTANSPGTATITVTLGTLDPTSVAVEVLGIASVDVTPSPISLNINETQKLTVTANLTGGGTRDLSGSAYGTTYASSNAAVASVNDEGVITGKAVGSATVSAKVGNLASVAVPVSVTLLEIESITVTPAEVSLTEVGQTVQLKVMGIPTEGGVSVDVTNSCLYTSDKAAVATVSAAGLITAVGAGSANITVKYGSLAPTTVAVSVLTGGIGEIIDLAKIGTALPGMIFQGFNEGAYTGNEFVRVGDFDADGVDDAIIVAQYGSPLSRPNVGMAWLLKGEAGTRVKGLTNVNEIGTKFPGIQFAARHRTGLNEDIPDRGTWGIVSAAAIKDVTGDAKPDLLFGMPFIGAFWNEADYDPSDADGAYGEDFWDTWCTNGASYDPIGWDQAGNLVEGGYAFFMASTLPLYDKIAIDMGMIGAGGASGTRYRGAWFDALQAPYGSAENPNNLSDQITGDTYFGWTVASLPDLSAVDPAGTNTRYQDGIDEILISIPNGLRCDISRPGDTFGVYSITRADRPGRIIVQWGQGAAAGNYGVDTQNISSMPLAVKRDPPCVRARGWPGFFTIIGKNSGDEMGWASSAGDFNNDGSTDILCGAPGADVNGTDSGILYIFFGSLTMGNIDLSVDDAYAPRIEIYGDAGDRLGGTTVPIPTPDQKQTTVQVSSRIDDFNGEVINDMTFDDIAFGIPLHDSDDLANSGMVCVLFGGEMITGENIFHLNQVATEELPGFIIKGVAENQRFGWSVATAGDFNNDGLGDLIITAPGEVREINGEQRRGVVYIVFGSADHTNKTFLASDIGTAKLPGRVFISPYIPAELFRDGTDNVLYKDDAPPLMAKGIGDVDKDGYDDIAIGIPQADYVYPDSENTYQRRPNAGEAYLIYGNSL